jgi:hypothetical protein
MQPRDNDEQLEDGEEKRDLELENTVGTRLVAEYQVDRLRARLSNMINSYRPQNKNHKASTHVFKHNNRWYKLSIRIDETDAAKEKEANQFIGYSTKVGIYYLNG